MVTGWVVQWGKPLVHPRFKGLVSHGTELTGCQIIPAPTESQTDVLCPGQGRKVEPDIFPFYKGPPATHTGQENPGVLEGLLLVHRYPCVLGHRIK